MHIDITQMANRKNPSRLRDLSYKKRYPNAADRGPRAAPLTRKTTMNSATPALDPAELLKLLTALRRAVNTPR
ncbi:hypothetical protein G3436_04765 [Pseudomonas sp. MAFF212427]|uniref:Uncharacterized protein n=1 Tax=Pseudomonas brassicae TaxID=2708063 RepID=A0A6B3NSC2_9PSED|nr:hypothetical protein [Pseudomonas brassicae]NER63328.1 hypothetical protein [Pseudomonas brassicae]